MGRLVFCFKYFSGHYCILAAAREEC